MSNQGYSRAPQRSGIIQLRPTPALLAQVKKDRELRVPVSKAAVQLSDITSAEVLTTLGIANLQDLEGFLHAKMAPKLSVPERNGTYHRQNRGDLNRDQMGPRVPGAPYGRATVGRDQPTYSCVEYGMEYVQPYEHRETINSPEDDDSAIKTLINIASISEERRFAAAAMTTSVWATDWTGAGSANFTQWGTAATGVPNASADPISVITRAAQLVRQASGKKPNRLALGTSAWAVLTDHPDVREIYAGSTTDPATIDTLSAYFGAKLMVPDFRIVVGEGSYNTAADGATPSFSDIISDVGLLAYIDPAPRRGAQTGLVTAIWDAFDYGGSSMGGAPEYAIESYEEKNINSKVFRAQTFRQYLVADSSCGLFLNAILA